MNKELSHFAATLRGLISNRRPPIGDRQFSALALELFALQFRENIAYRKICAVRSLTPQIVEHWTQIPAVPTGALKEMEFTSIPPGERTAVFYSSGTTEQKPSRHFHCAESLAVYEASLWTWFGENLLRSADGSSASPDETRGHAVRAPIFLTPPPTQVPHSSLVYMFETVRQKLGALESAFVGKLTLDGAWTLNFNAVTVKLAENSKLKIQNPKLILGTAFSFVHLLDFLVEKNLHLTLPAGSRVLETGGYKNRSRSLSKNELHALITERLGVTRENILCEYGMSELSSQAYDSGIQHSKFKIQNSERQFQFPTWSRVQIISPETGREVAEGETGLIRIFDLANVFSVAAIQTEDLGVRRGEGFELLGRAALSEPRGCSLMAA